MNATLKTIHALHSTHGGFTDRDLPAEHLRRILEAAVRAASASARQSYAIIVVDDKPAMKEYLGYVGSKALLFCVDYIRLVDTAAHLGRTYAPDGLQDFVTGSTDTILAAQTAAIAAASLGIDSLFTNSMHRKPLNRLYERFNLPSRYCFPLIALVLGYAERSARRRGRLLEPGVVHFGSYQKLTRDEAAHLVAAHDAPQNDLGLIFHQGPDYYQWFFDHWCKSARTREAEDEKRRELYAVLETSGFIDPRWMNRS